MFTVIEPSTFNNLAILLLVDKEIVLYTESYNSTVFSVNNRVKNTSFVTNLWLTKFNGLILYVKQNELPRLFLKSGENFYSEKSKMSAKQHEKNFIWKRILFKHVTFLDQFGVKEFIFDVIFVIG